jgi:hypothetical protein
LLSAATVGVAEEGLMLRPVDVRTTGSTKYEDPLHVDEAIAFYRIYLDDNKRFLQNGNAAEEQQ